MKARLLSILLAALLAASLSGCGGAAPSPTPSGEAGITIAASFYPMYVMLLNIAGDVSGVTVVDMTEPTTGCLHDYAPTTRDMLNLEGARILVVNGAGMESFMDKVVAQFPHLAIIDASEGIPLIADGAGNANPHVWVSVSNAIAQVKTVSARLAELDPGRAAAYNANADAYVKKLEALRDEMHAALEKYKGTAIVTFHEAFPYFAQEFGLDIAGVVEREPGSEPSAKELAGTIDLINSLNVKALFAEPQYSPASADAIAAETDRKVYTLDPAVTGPMEPDAYISIMEDNLKVLEEALK
jgi:zinc transport system substrate-binding protein